MSFRFPRCLFPIIGDHVKTRLPLTILLGNDRVSGVRRSVLNNVREWMVVVIGWQADAPRIHNQSSVRKSNSSWDMGMAAQNERSIGRTCSFCHFVQRGRTDPMLCHRF